MMVFIFVAVSCTVIPLRIAFFDDDLYLPWTIIDLFSDGIFIIDIVVTFFTIEEDEYGTPIVSLKGIARKYIRGFFFLDLIASIPISTIMYLNYLNQESSAEYNQNLHFINLIKTLKVYRIMVIFKVLRILRQSKLIEVIARKFFITPQVSSVFTNMVRLLFLVHFIGCMWGLVAVTFETEFRDNWLRDKDLENASPLERYTTSCYWAVMTITTVGYGEISPVNVYEATVCILLMWSGVTTQSYIMSRLQENFLKKRDSNDTKSDKIENFFKTSNVPVQDQEKVQYFFQPNQSSIIH